VPGRGTVEFSFWDASNGAHGAGVRLPGHYWWKCLHNSGLAASLIVPFAGGGS